LNDTNFKIPDVITRILAAAVGPPLDHAEEVERAMMTIMLSFDVNYFCGSFFLLGGKTKEIHTTEAGSTYRECNSSID